MKVIILTVSALLMHTTLAFCSGADTIHLKMIPSIEPPVIKNRVARISVNFIFDRVPSSGYWMHYDREHHLLVFEFFGVHLGDSLPSIRGTDVLKNLSVENGSTDLAFDRMVSRLSMGLEPGWHYESWVTGGTTLRLSLWTYLDPAKKIGKKDRDNRYVVYGGIFALLTVGALYLIIGH